MSPAPAPLRVAVIGARRVRNGTGPYLARHARSAGALAVAVVGTTADSAGRARAELAAQGMDVAAATCIEELHAAGPVDALFVASPSGTHRPWLDAALAAGWHLLCEKPLLAGPSDDAAALRAGAAAAEELAAAFAHRGLVLEETCQWRFAWPAFQALHGAVRLTTVSRFRMRLAPAEAGRAGWVDALSHPLSLLQRIAPGAGQAERVHYSGQGREERLEFDYRAGDACLACRVEIVPQAAPPRPAEYELDGRLVRRVIEPGYRFRFESGPPQERSLAVGDPMESAVGSFLAAAAAARAGQPVAENDELVQRQVLLAHLLGAHPSLS